MRVIRRLICPAALLFFLTCTATPCLGQQYNNWVFGEASWLSFGVNSSANPRNLTGSTMITDEGSSSISDLDGNLLFYTNGEKIYNKDHRVMLNGDGIMGNESSFQNSIIVPRPGSTVLYYVFTTDAFENSFANGYRYSIVDIRGDNGKGEVQGKNVLLQAGGSERITAVRHSNGTDIWILTNDRSSNTFRSWLLTCDGLQTNPVVSTLGEILVQERMNIGSMKVSPDGKQVCQTFFAADAEDTLGNFIQLFDFSPGTGVFSNAKRIDLISTGFASCEFSPNSSLLYLTIPNQQVIVQLEPRLFTTSQITASRVNIPAQFGYYGIQLGPDRKIYLSKASTKLSVIHQPDVPGIGCNFQVDRIDMNGYGARLNLPFVLNDAEGHGFTHTILDSCRGRVQFNGFTNWADAVEWKWDFGDGNTSTLQNPVHSYFPANQYYYVRLTIRSLSTCGFISKADFILPGGINTKADFDFIAKCDSSYVRFINKTETETSLNYLWRFGDGNTSTDVHPIHSYSGSAIYSITLKTISNLPCLNDSITRPLDLKQLTIDAIPDLTIDEGQSVRLDVTGGGMQYSWSPSTALSNPNTKSPLASPAESITYFVTATNELGCRAMDSIYVRVNPLNDIYVPSAFTPNGDGRNDVFRPVVGQQYTIEEFSVYDRWGRKVFQTSIKGHGWNGRIQNQPQATGSYIWILKVKAKDGASRMKKGTVVLIQ